MSTTTQTAATVRTSAVARAERLARRESRTVRPVTDAAGDALLPAYDRADAYPALTSRNLDRRETRDAARRDCSKLMEEDSNGPRPNNLRVLGDLSAVNPCNTSDANFNHITPSGGAARSVLADLAAEEVEQVLRALCLSEDTARIVRLRLAGYTLEQIGTEYGTTKQTIDRRLQGVGKALFGYWLDAASRYDGAASLFLAETTRTVYHGLTGGRPVARVEVCDCGSHQARVQRVKGQEGEVTFHCTNCKAKYSRSEYESLSGGQAVWGN